jgi:hypothetical protein
MTLGIAQTASATLILLGPNPEGGTGLGTVETVLTLSSPGSSSNETGCVRPSGSGSTTAGCGFLDASVMTGAGQIGTPTLGAIGATSASNLRVVFNASEPASDSITLNNLVLSIYDSTGTVLFTSGPSGPFVFPTTFSGTGNSGFLFGLDATQAAQAQAAAFGTGFANNRIGLGASLSNATGGLETFFVAAVPQTVPVPDGGSLSMLLGLTLLGLAGVRRMMP